MMFELLMFIQAASPATLPPLHGGPQPITCPVGGEKFEAWQPSMYSTYGERPDGRPYSYLPFPFPIPECPSNKLLMFDQFSAAEIERLPAILDAPVYRAMMGKETPYYRASWLARQLGRPEAQILSLLLRATWETKPGEMGPLDTAANRAATVRYQRLFVEAFGKARAALPADERSAFGARATNAWRELGAFEQAETTRRVAIADLTATADGRGWRKFLEQLGPAITRHDAASEPLDLVPKPVAMRKCRAAPTDDFARDYCARPELREPARAVPAARTN